MARIINYPFNLFHTSMNLSPEKIEKTSDIFQLHSLPHNDVSILEIYKLEIERYIKDKNDKKKNTYNKLKNADNIKLLKYAT